MRGGSAYIRLHSRAEARPSRSGKLADADQVPTVNVCRVGLSGAGKLGRVGRRRKIRGGIGMNAGCQRCSRDKKLTSCSWHLVVTDKHCPKLRGPAGLADVAAGGTCGGTGMSATQRKTRLTGSVTTRRFSGPCATPRPRPTSAYLLLSVLAPRSNAAGAGALRPRGDELMDAMELELGSSPR